MADTIVVGIGNPYRGDDAVGWAVIDALESKVPQDVHLSRMKGDIAGLIDIFAHYTNVYIVDACSGNASPGAWQRIDALQKPLSAESGQTSTHGFSVSQAVALARNLDSLPEKLTVFAVYGDNYAISDEMSPAVSEAVDQVVQELLKEEDILKCMNKA